MAHVNPLIVMVVYRLDAFKDFFPKKIMLLQEAELQSEKKSSFIHEFERFDKGQWNATVFDWTWTELKQRTSSLSHTGCLIPDFNINHFYI